ncbi:hypothetical protein ACVOMV_36610 [Mesorhizobium atlanticum]
MRLGGKPMLNLSGTEQGSPTTTFTSMLELKDPQRPCRRLSAQDGSSAGSANFNILDPGATVGHVRFSGGEIVIDKYDAASKTISGHFSAFGKANGQARRTRGR